MRESPLRAPRRESPVAPTLTANSNYEDRKSWNNDCDEVEEEFEEKDEEEDEEK